MLKLQWCFNASSSFKHAAKHSLKRSRFSAPFLRAVLQGSLRSSTRSLTFPATWSSQYRLEDVGNFSDSEASCAERADSEAGLLFADLSWECRHAAQRRGEACRWARRPRGPRAAALAMGMGSLTGLSVKGNAVWVGAKLPRQEPLDGMKLPFIVSSMEVPQDHQLSPRSLRFLAARPLVAAEPEASPDQIRAQTHAAVASVDLRFIVQRYTALSKASQPCSPVGRALRPGPRRWMAKSPTSAALPSSPAAMSP